MEITRQQSGEVLELRVKGRLDSYWADPLAKRLDEVIREGAHQIRLNLSEVAYLSSAGIRVLVKFYKQLQGIHGSFIVSNPSEPVKTVLELAGLGALLIAQAAPTTTAAVTQDRVRQFERGNATFEIFEHKRLRVPHPADRPRGTGTEHRPTLRREHGEYSWVRTGSKH